MKDELDAVRKVANEASDKADKAIEMVGEQDKIILTCAIVSAVAAIAITSFVAFCIYQGVKLEKEGKNDLSKDTPNGKFNNVSDTEKLKDSLQEGRTYA
ncbi:MAG: hypothetical protein ACR5LA_11235 [Wolbachia sp.]